jgi:prepilin-type N-terminal cleavage/methylation domain-containing protein
MTRTRRGFTLLELLMAFGVSTILLATVYFFYFGILKMNTGGMARIELNQIAETTLLRLTADLRMAYRFTEIRPHRLVLQRLPASAITSDELSNVNGPPLTTVEYELVKLDKLKKVQLQRRENQAVTPDEVFTLDYADYEIFKGFVLDMPVDKEDTMPKFHVFDHVQQPSGDLQKIALMRISLHLGVGPTDKFHLVSKVYMPFIHNATLQGNWNLE